MANEIFHNILNNYFICYKNEYITVVVLNTAQQSDVNNYKSKCVHDE